MLLHSGVVLPNLAFYYMSLFKLYFPCISKKNGIENCLQAMINVLHSGDETNRWVYIASLKVQNIAEILAISHHH